MKILQISKYFFNVLVRNEIRMFLRELLILLSLLIWFKEQQDHEAANDFCGHRLLKLIFLLATAKFCFILNQIWRDSIIHLSFYRHFFHNSIIFSYFCCIDPGYYNLDISLYILTHFFKYSYQPPEESSLLDLCRFENSNYKTSILFFNFLQIQLKHTKFPKTKSKFN